MFLNKKRGLNNVWDNKQECTLTRAAEESETHLHKIISYCGWSKILGIGTAQEHYNGQVLQFNNYTEHFCYRFFRIFNWNRSVFVELHHEQDSTKLHEMKTFIKTSWKHCKKHIATSHGNVTAGVKLWSPLNASPEACITDPPKNSQRTWGYYMR